MGWRRQGGHGTGPDGVEVTWSAAEGRRGTRWRETVAGDAVVRHALLLEVAPSGRTTRLEIAGPAGMLTLHPEPDESALHGNVVTQGGVVHLALAWSATDVLLVLASPTALAVALTALGTTVEVGTVVDRAVVVVEADLRPRRERWRLAREAEEAWRLEPIGGPGVAAPGQPRLVRVGRDGAPALDDAATWPLES